MINSIYAINNPQTIAWVKDVLTNDEQSSDEEMIEYFMKEGDFSEDLARELVFYRGTDVEDIQFIYE